MSIPSTVEVIATEDCTTLINEGFTSLQLLWPKNSPEAKATITRVTMEPGAVSGRHSHKTSEQIWVVEKGTGMLLLDAGHERPLKAGDIVRTPTAEIHGVRNIGDGEFIYLSITTPPQDFTSAYRSSR